MQNVSQMDDRHLGIKEHSVPRCNCQLQNKSRVQNTICNCRVSVTPNIRQRAYIGIAEEDWKQRYHNHKISSRNDI